MRRKQTVLAFEHIATKISIKTANACSVCPHKIYCDEGDTVTMGIGNIHSNFIFILPTYDIKTKLGYNNILSLLADAYNKIKGKSLFEDIYVTRLVKCSQHNAHNIYNSSIAPCSNYLSYEINKLYGKHIVFFGSSYEDYNANGGVKIYTHNRFIHKLYSPAVLYYDNPVIKKKFLDDLSVILNYY